MRTEHTDSPACSQQLYSQKPRSGNAWINKTRSVHIGEVEQQKGRKPTWATAPVSLQDREKAGRHMSPQTKGPVQTHEPTNQGALRTRLVSELVEMSRRRWLRAAQLCECTNLSLPMKPVSSMSPTHISIQPLKGSAPVAQELRDREHKAAKPLPTRPGHLSQTLVYCLPFVHK